MPEFQRRLNITLHILEGHEGANFYVLPTERELYWERQQLETRMRAMGAIAPPEESAPKGSNFKEMADKLRQQTQSLQGFGEKEVHLQTVLEETAQTLELLAQTQRRAQDLLARFEEKKAKVEALRNEATPLSFSLRIPTYAEYLEAREQATRVDYDTGRVDFDPIKMIRFLLPRCVEGHTETEVLNLPPQIADKLAQHLSMSINPGDDEINFLYSSYSRCSTGVSPITI